MSHSLWSMLVGFSALQGLFLFIILLSRKKGRKSSNVLLAVVVLSIGILAAQFALLLNGIHNSFPYITIPMNWIRWGVGPLLFLYIKTLVDYKFRFQWNNLLHFIPMMGMIIYSVTRFSEYTWDQHVWYVNFVFQSENLELPFSTYVWMFLNKIHPMIYGLLCYFQIRAFQSNLNKRNLKLLASNLKWIKSFLVAFISYQAIAIIFVYGLFEFQFYAIVVDVAVVFLYAVLIHLIAVAAMLHPEHLFSSVFAAIQNKSFNSENNSADKNMITQLIDLMQNEKPFVDGNLKLADLAKKMGTNSHVLSHIINEYTGSNFQDFINAYRVRELQLRMANKEYLKYSLLGLSYDVGFNSKASLNRVFKKHTGTTPSEYLQSLSNNPQELELVS